MESSMLHSHIVNGKSNAGYVTEVLLTLSPMFKFDFDIEDPEDSEDLLNIGISSINIQETSSKEHHTPELETFSEISLQQLVRDLCLFKTT